MLGEDGLRMVGDRRSTPSSPGCHKDDNPGNEEMEGGEAMSIWLLIGYVLFSPLIWKIAYDLEKER